MILPLYLLNFIFFLKNPLAWTALHLISSPTPHVCFLFMFDWRLLELDSTALIASSLLHHSLFIIIFALRFRLRYLLNHARHTVVSGSAELKKNSLRVRSFLDRLLVGFINRFSHCEIRGDLEWA